MSLPTSEDSTYIIQLWKSLLQAVDGDFHRNVSCHRIAVANEDIHLRGPGFWKANAGGHTSGRHVDVEVEGVSAVREVTSWRGTSIHTCQPGRCR